MWKSRAGREGRSVVLKSQWTKALGTRIPLTYLDLATRLPRLPPSMAVSSFWSFLWASLPIVPATSAGSGRMDSGFGCRRSGDVQYSADGARKAGSGSPSSSRPSTPAPEHASYPRRYRLTRGTDLHKVLREGKRARTEHLEVRLLVSLLRHPRVGIIVPKHRHSIVERNRLKRRLREIIRLEILPLVSMPADIVVRAGPRAYGASFDMLRTELIAGISRVAGRSGGVP